MMEEHETLLNQINKEAKERIKRELRYRASNLETIKTNRSEAWEALVRMYEGFLKRTIVEQRRVPYISTEDLKKHFEKLANKLNRPFIWVEYNYGHAFLNLPKLKTYNPLVAPLLIAATRVVNSNTYHKERAPLELQELATRYYFNFYGDVGKEIYQNWRDQLDKNPATRKALRIPEVIEL